MDRAGNEKLNVMGLQIPVAANWIVNTFSDKFF